MQTLELFSGFSTFSFIARHRGHRTFTVDWDPDFGTDLVTDIRKLKRKDIPIGHVDLLWASPPCETYSVAGLWQHLRTKERPLTGRALMADYTVINTLGIIKEIDPTYWVLENPRGLLRKMPFMQGIPRATVTYCQYGHTNMKPTDLFGRLPPSFVPKACKNGAPCHQRVPRGVWTGTQALDTKIAAMVPPALCTDIIASAERDLDK